MTPAIHHNAPGAALSLLETGVLERLRNLAEARVGQPTPPGVWIGSAAALARAGRRMPPPRRLRETLQRLEQQGLLRTWCPPGQRGPYPILIDRRVVADASGQRFLTDAHATQHWRSPVLRRVPATSPRPSALPGDTTALPSRLLVHHLPDQIHLLYRRERGRLAVAPPLTAARRQRMVERALAWPGGPTGFLLDLQSALRKARRSRFLLGANRSLRPFGLDWLLADPQNIRKTLAGRYDDPPSTTPANRPVQSEFAWSEPPAPDPPGSPVPDAFALPRQPEAAAEWARLLTALHRRMNPKSLATWFRPLRAAGFDGSTLVLEAPTGDFARVLDRFAAELPPGAPPLRLHCPLPPGPR